MGEMPSYRPAAERTQNPDPRKRIEVKPIEIGYEEKPAEKTEGVMTLGEFEGTGQEREEEKTKEMRVLESGLESSTDEDRLNFLKNVPEVMAKDPALNEFPNLKQSYNLLIRKALNLLGTKKILNEIGKDIRSLKNLPPEQNAEAKEKIYNYINSIASVAEGARKDRNIQFFLDELKEYKDSLIT